MGRKTFMAEQIIFKHREVEVLVGQGASIAIPVTVLQCVQHKQ